MWVCVCSASSVHTPQWPHPQMKGYGDYRDKKPPSLSEDAERIVHPRVLNTNLSACVTAPFITHKANPVSGTKHSVSPSSPRSRLSDRAEMNIRTHQGCVFKWFVSLSLQWSQFPQANKPGNDFISEKEGLSVTLTSGGLWGGETDCRFTKDGEYYTNPPRYQRPQE